jgi:phenylacetate-CoA ligase
LRQLQAARGSHGLTPAAPLPGDWPAGCDAYLASFPQARLWFLHQLEPDLTAYHLQALWRLRGELDVSHLRTVLEELIQRHSTLRTSFLLQGSEVIQIVHPAAPFALTEEALGERDAEEVIGEWLEEESRTPFDLTAGLLLRARLLEVDGEEHVLLINHHHIASDGWSRSVLARDLVELYNAHHAGQSPQLEPFSVHYHDYAAWQRQRLSGERLQELNDYWISQLSDLEPVELPSDHPRPVTPSYRGESVCFQIEPALLEPFEELCRREGATLQMGLLAVVALLLHCYSRQEDFAIGVPIWGRNHPDLERLIGFFINTLPIRTRFKPEQSFRELLVQVRDTSIDAYDHQELPFEQMVEALKVERDTSRNPLVQVMLQLIELPETGLDQLDGLAAQSLPFSSDSAKFDLSLYLRRSADQGLSASITYAKDLFDGDRIVRLRSHLITLLNSVLQAPDQPAAALNFLPELERQLIESWQQRPAVELPELPVPDELLETPSIDSADRHDLRCLGSDQIACALAERAKECVPAYRRFLDELGIDAGADFGMLPTTDKAEYLLSALPEDIQADDIDATFTYFRSSGSSGRPFLWPQLQGDYRWSARRMRDFLETTYRIHERRTLAVVGLALGSWVGGDQYSWVLKNVALETPYPFAVISPGNRHEEIIELIKHQQHNVDQFLLVICPSHIGHLRLLAEALGQPLPLERLRFLVVGEVFPESFRRSLLRRSSQTSADPFMISLYGSADTGSLAVESLASIALRRLLEDDSSLAARFGFCRPLPHFFHCTASDAYIETVDGELCVTRWQGIPLLRYNLHDRARLLAWEPLRQEVLQWADPDLVDAADLQQLRDPGALPDLIALTGRSDDAILLGGTTITAAMLDDVMSRPALAELLTGAYRAAAPFEDDRQFLDLELELRADLIAETNLPEVIAAEMVLGLCQINPEFANDWEAVYRSGIEDPSRRLLRLNTVSWPLLSDGDGQRTKRLILPSS